ncbi:MAG: type II toxin-antitoxin system PemK/MazF family toxin [Verrucomicrobia bacterium]|nr:type II toxin-antitoxin system PemK/MazF family toxin [Verrucomicrobiota bacterium]
MPLPRIQRGEIWRVDLGYLGKVRPVLVVSVTFLENERTLCIVVPHTNSLRGTRFEISVPHPVLAGGAFDVQQTAAVQAIKFIQRLGTVNADQMGQIEQALAQVLGLKLAEGPQAQS